jgi:hypothetical protein
VAGQVVGCCKRIGVLLLLPVFLQMVPFLLEDKLKELGGDYSRVADWGEYVVVDGNLITGQNPGEECCGAVRLSAKQCISIVILIKAGWSGLVLPKFVSLFCYLYCIDVVATCVVATWVHHVTDTYC